MKNSSLWGGLLLHDFSLAWFVFELPLWKSSCLITLEIWSLVLNLVLLSSKSRLTKHWFHSFYVYLNRKLDRIGDSLPTKGLSSLVYHFEPSRWRSDQWIGRFFKSEMIHKLFFLQRFLMHFAMKPVFDISVNTNISILGFYGYIGNIKKISMDIFTQILVRQKSFKIDGNA